MRGGVEANFGQCLKEKRLLVWMSSLSRPYRLATPKPHHPPLPQMRLILWENILGRRHAQAARDGASRHKIDYVKKVREI